MATFVISLAKSYERRERLLAKMSKHLADLTIVEAMEASARAPADASTKEQVYEPAASPVCV